MQLAIEIVEPSVKLITSPAMFAEMIRIAEYFGRLSHKSEDRQTETSAELFLRKWCTDGELETQRHESVLEHAAQISMHFVMSRAASHQLVRHRLCAFCVTGDTQLVAHSAPMRSPKRWTIEQLYRWQDDSKRKGRLKLIRLRTVDPDGRIVPGRIRRVIDTGLQHVFEIKTRCGRALRCTDNEWFQTRQGWRQLHELRCGDRVLVNGELAYRNEEWLRQHYLVRNLQRPEVAQLAGVSDACIGKWLHHFDLQKPREQYSNRQPGHGLPGMHGEAGEAQISKRMRGSGNHRWKGDEASAQAGRMRAYRLHPELGTCDCCERPATSRHHVNGDTLDNSATNILPLCDGCHAGHHIGHAVLTVFESPITSILAVGIERTFDVEMDTDDDQLRNYVAAGFVVHNTQESQRYCDYSHPKFGNVLKVICPPKVTGGEPIPTGLVVAGEYDAIAETVKITHCEGDTLKDPTACARFSRWSRKRLVEYAEYQLEREEGIPAEDARYNLPNAAKTEIGMTTNARQWRHVFTMRCDHHAQWELRGLMTVGLRLCADAMPIVFADDKMQALDAE